ncbi:MAG: DUF255 domain-containing protein [Bacteroidales bacterium]|jgi:thioredoxin-related protein|nr:DUF255 domain-containing protein [Bacteroidales bacterium]
MKKILLTLAIIASFGFCNAQKINWMTFQEAVELNRTAPKKIFIDTYTDWCGWCKKMDQTTFQDSLVVAYMNENYYAVKLNAEMNDTIVFGGYTYVNNGGMNGRRGTHQLAAALLQGNMSYPSYVFMNEKNQLITVAPGYMDASQFLPVLKYIGTDAYLKQSFKDYIK